MMNTKTFNIVLPKDLVAKVDIAAKKEYRNRSELIREALRVYLKDQQEWAEIFEYGRAQARKLGVTSEADIDEIVTDYRHGR
ncbi:MAG: ribbon-helix-helix domain-containing protein [Candidatus Berkelbacteria bacterium]|nr:ribbon-helix-helix domain-containing protein [Candidatus Berkelbacteria bacterium]